MWYIDTDKRTGKFIATDGASRVVCDTYSEAIAIVIENNSDIDRD